MGYSNLEQTDTGFLVNLEDWSDDVAREIAADDGLTELTDKHWDLINYLREEYVNNGGNQPSERHMVKAMSAAWGEKISAGDLYDLFPKQATKIAGLPETKRKGGY